MDLQGVVLPDVVPGELKMHAGGLAPWDLWAAVVVLDLSFTQVDRSLTAALKGLSDHELAAGAFGDFGEATPRILSEGHPATLRFDHVRDLAMRLDMPEMLRADDLRGHSLLSQWNSIEVLKILGPEAQVQISGPSQEWTFWTSSINLTL